MKYNEFDSKVKALENHRKKRISVEIIANTLGSVLTAIFLFPLCYGYTLEFCNSVAAVNEPISVNLPVITGFWNFFATKGTLFSFLPQLLSVALFGVILTLLVPILVTGIYSLIIYNIHSKNEPSNEKASISSLEKISIRLEDANNGYLIPNFVSKLINIFFLIITFIICFSIMNKVRADADLPNKIAEIFLVVIMVILYFIPFFAFNKISVSASSFMWKNNKKAESEELNKHIKAEISKLKKEKEENDKKRIEKAKLEQEKNRIEKLQKDIAEGQELYGEALVESNKDKIKAAAKLGHPKACHYLGKDLINDLNSDMYTSEEKEEIAEIAAEYFDTARQNAKIAQEEKAFETECTFLWLYCRVQYERNGKDKWQEILNSLRKIQKSGELSEGNTELLESAIKDVVNVIDEIKSKTLKQPTYNPPPEPKKFYCIFRNGAICTKESGSTVTYHCNYVHNPSACIIARQNNAIEYH